MGKERLDAISCGAIIVAALAVLWFHTQRREPRELAVTELLPPEAELLVDIALDEVRRHAPSLLERAAGVDTPLGACNYDPATSSKHVGIAVSFAPTAADPELALAFTGPFRLQRLLDCMHEVALGRGRQATLSQLGSFSLLRPAASPTRIAVRNGGPILVGHAASVSGMVARAERPEAPATPSRPAATHGQIELTHDWLRRAVGAGTVRATYVPIDSSAGALRLLSGIQAGAATLRIEPPHARIQLVLICTAPERCRSTQSQLEQLGSELAGARPRAAALHLESSDRQLRGELQLRLATVMGLLEDF